MLHHTHDPTALRRVKAQTWDVDHEETSAADLEPLARWRSRGGEPLT